MFISTQICQDSMLLHASFKMQRTNSELWQHFRQHFFRIDSHKEKKKKKSHSALSHPIGQ